MSWTGWLIYKKRYDGRLDGSEKKLDGYENLGI